MLTETKTYRYQELDALRGIASMMVLFYHISLGLPEARFGFNLGLTGVDLFFIISGFVIYMSLNRVSTGSEFVINRVSRLYPTYWTSVILAYILLSLFPVQRAGTLASVTPLDFLGNMTMFQFYLKLPNLDGTYWTMIIEMIFYIAILILFQLKLLKRLNMIGIAACILSLVMTHFLYHSSLVRSIIALVPLLQFVPLFFAGTIFYKIYTNKNKLLENYAIIIFCLISQILLYEYAGRYKKFMSYGDYTGMLIAFFVIFTLFVNGKLKFMVNRVTLFLGKISFALYLTHHLVLSNYVMPFLLEKMHMNFWVASIVFAIPIGVAVAAVITFYIEVPLNKKLREKLRMIAGVSKVIKPG